MDSVKLAASSTNTAAYADFRIHLCSAAGETALCLSLHLLFRECETLVGERLDLGRLRARFLSYGVVVAVDDKVVLVYHVEVVSLYTADCEAVLPYISMDGLSSFLTGGDCFNSKAGACVNVASDKAVGLSRLICPLVRLGGVVSVEFHILALEEVAPDNGLTDSGKYIVTLNCLGVFLIILGSKFMICVKDGCALLEYDAPNVENEDSFRKKLKVAGFVTRDPRAKERKKPGLKAARRAPQFSKR